MKKSYEITLVLIVLLFIIGLGLWRAISLSISHPHLSSTEQFAPVNSNNILSKEDAIAVAQAAYPELKNYPSNNLPPTSIDASSSADGWYLAFETEGSGVPYLLGAKCYEVTSNKEVIFTGEYVFQSNAAYKPMKVRVSDCQPEE